MAVTLSKGQNVSLSKTDPSLKHILIGLGWDARSSNGEDFDLDASVFMAAAKFPTMPILCSTTNSFPPAAR